MSRLIDADLLKKNIAKWLQGSDPQETRMVQIEDIAVSVYMEIEEQPTAFDTEKVIADLESEKIIHYGLHTEETDIMKIDDAIDIVKKGGVE